MIFSEMLSFDDIKKEPFIIQNIRWELQPKDLMEPKYTTTGEGVKVREPIKGYVFYIDTTDEKPMLFLMRHTAVDYAETLAQINEIPQEMLRGAVEENKAGVYFNMYPINKSVEGWLKRELGIKE
ncbi:MAG: hypothetical protein M1353_04785 [Nitrospirae bacterium]|nr:hypothetical protein [Nitrospirota bacterium]